MCMQNVVRIPGKVMAQLRAQIVGAAGEPLTQVRAAQLFGVSRRTLQSWEARGASVAEAYGYVGLAFRVSGELGAARLLGILAQLNEIEGAAVAVRMAG